MPIAAVLMTLAALVSIALALEVLAVWRSVSEDDFRFETASAQQRDLWKDLGLLPGSLGVHVLDLEDDLRYRRVAELYARARPGAGVTGPRIESLRGQAQLELTRASEAESNPPRQSRLLTLLGVLPLDNPSQDFEERTGQLQTAIGIFQSAIKVDPGNADAKLNLELLLRDAAVLGLPPNQPSGEPAGGKLSGPGGVGRSSGY